MHEIKYFSEVNVVYIVTFVIARSLESKNMKGEFYTEHFFIFIALMA